MPLQKFNLIFDDLTKMVDIDEEEKHKEVPVNMVFTGENEITKDTGCEVFANTGTGIIKSLYNYKKQDGNKYFIRSLGTVLQKYNPSSGNFEDFKTGLSEGKKFGFKEYDNWLYLGNGVNNYARWDGSIYTEYSSAPKGNILEVFENRMFVAGDPNNPLSLYYSVINEPTSFPSQNVVKPLGTDKITGLVNYYGRLLILKEKSIWQLTFVWEGSSWVPKLELFNANYGCCGMRAYTWVENDIWFFTGQEVRSMGWRGGYIGVLGLSPGSMSEQIKNSLKKVNQDKLEDIEVFYYKRKFYLSIPYSTSEINNYVFVCDTSYGNIWTKFVKRPKAKVSTFVVWEKDIYSASSEIEGRLYRWTDNYSDAGLAIDAYVPFRAIGDKDFATTQIYKLLDVEFKNIIGNCLIKVIVDDFDERMITEREFYVGVMGGELEAGTVGELLVGEWWVGGGSEEVEESNYLKRRFTMLVKGQSIKLILGNNKLGETFTISKFALSGLQKPRKYITRQHIIDI